MKKISFILPMLLLLNMGLYSQNTNEFEFNWEATHQEKNQRVLGSELVLIEELLMLEEVDLFEFAYLDSDSNGNLVGYDFSKERIIFFPFENPKNFSEITEGRGRGPRELKLARDIKFDANGTIWVIDLEGGKIQNWNSNNLLIQNFKPNKKYARPYRLAVCDDSIYILSEQYLGEGLYHKYDLNGNNLLSFKTITNRNKEEFRLWTDASYFRGDLTCFDENLFHVGRYKNYIRRYDLQGNLLFSKKVIEFEGNEEPLLVIDRRSSRRKEDVKEISGQVEIIGDKVLVSFSGRKNYHFYILDIYDLNGNYIASYRFKHPTKEFTTDGKFIYALETHRNNRKEYLAKYKLPQLD